MLSSKHTVLPQQSIVQQFGLHFFQGFYSIMSEHDLNVITIVWLAVWEEHVVPFYCFTIFIS